MLPPTLSLAEKVAWWMVASVWHVQWSSELATPSKGTLSQKWSRPKSGAQRKP